MSALPLACTVRDCGLPLERRERTLVCARHHSYDIARSGYINLLQPQDRRSPQAGDSKAATEARARLLASGVGRAMLDAFVEQAAAICGHRRATVVDLGSGSGELLAALHDRQPIAGFGIDVSTAAAEHAARRFPSITWVVANADRRLPLLDRSVQLVVSFNARRNPAECARVLAEDGRLLVAIPAPDDLIELRAVVQGNAMVRDRASLLVAEHESLFTVTEHSSISERHLLNRNALIDLLRVSYRGARFSEVESVDTLTSLDITMASDFFQLAPHRK